MESRMEYNFLRQADIPLGIFNSLPEVAKWMAEQRRHHTYTKTILDVMKTGFLSAMFPGIGLRDAKHASLSPDIKQGLARELFGTIPHHGVYLGESRKPQGQKPRLIN